MEYTEVLFTPASEAFSSEILAAVLGDSGYEMFEDTQEGVAAYIPSSLFDASILSSLLDPAIPAFTGLTWVSRNVPYVNWNAEWEKNFEPVAVGNRLLIRAEYHSPDPEVQHEIIIRPGMAFGTGHHATTWMMADTMMDLPIRGKKVLDMGTGSGVLAILAARLGATDVLAVDFDEHAADNARINADLNHSAVVRVMHGIMRDVHETDFDLLLANINRNIILDDIARYAAALQPGGTLLVSGFYAADLSAISIAAEAQGFVPEGSKIRNNWCLAAFRKNTR